MGRGGQAPVRPGKRMPRRGSEFGHPLPRIPRTRPARSDMVARRRTVPLPLVDTGAARRQRRLRAWSTPALGWRK